MIHAVTVHVIDRYDDGRPRVYLAECACRQAKATPEDGEAARWADEHPRTMHLILAGVAA